MRIFFVLPLLLFCSAQVRAESRLGLKEAIELAMKKNAEINAQRFQIEQAAQDIRRVSGEFGPHIEGILGVGPITKASGDATFVREDGAVWGRMIIGKISATMPLYSWGRKGNYQSAAEAGVHVKEAEQRLKENEVRYQVKEAFYGFQLANSLRDFIEGGKSELLKALDKRKGAKKDAKADFKLEIFLREVESREAEVVKYFELAKEGFALRVGAARSSVLPKDEWLLPAAREKKNVVHYVQMAAADRPEFRQLSEGVFAKRSMAKGEQKALLPILAVMASYEAAQTNVRTPQPGVFAYDPYNKKATAGGIGLKWDFQWELQNAKAAKLRAEADELEAKEVFARQGIETEVRKAFLELEEAESRLKAATEAQKIGKRWLTGELIGYSAGLAGAAGLVEAYGARAETAKGYFEAVYRHHMAWANLSKVVGDEVDPLLQ